MAKQNNQRRNFFSSPKGVNHQNLYLYIIIVNYGYSDPVVEWLRHYGSNVQFVCLGRGTASSNATRMLGMENNDKEVIGAFVSEENLQDVKNELTKLFAIHKKPMGFGFTIKLSSLVGEKMYYFLSNFI